MHISNLGFSSLLFLIQENCYFLIQMFDVIYAAGDTLVKLIHLH